MIAGLVFIMSVMFLVMVHLGLDLYELRVDESATQNSGRVGLVAPVFEEVKGLS